MAFFLFSTLTLTLSQNDCGLEVIYIFGTESPLGKHFGSVYDIRLPTRQKDVRQVISFYK